MIRQIAFNKPQQVASPSTFRTIDERNHSQNVHRRRVNNICGDPANVKGTPVPGILTPVEIAHRARRKQRRIARLNALSDAASTAKDHRLSAALGLRVSRILGLEQVNS